MVTSVTAINAARRGFSEVDPVEDTESGRSRQRARPYGRGFSEVDPVEDTESYATAGPEHATASSGFSEVDPVEDTERGTCAHRARRADRASVRSIR